MLYDLVGALLLHAKCLIVRFSNPVFAHVIRSLSEHAWQSCRLFFYCDLVFYEFPYNFS